MLEESLKDLEMSGDLRLPHVPAYATNKRTCDVVCPSLEVRSA